MLKRLQNLQTSFHLQDMAPQIMFMMQMIIPVAPKYLMNAIDIDWNEADFANASAPSSEPTTINTSGDLIKDIKWASTVGSGSGGGHGQMGVTGAQGIHGISS